MSWYRFLPFILTAAGLGVLVGFLRGPSPRRAEAAASVPSHLAGLATARPDPAAVALVRRSRAGLARPDRAWLRTTVWLRARLPDLTYHAEGFYLRAPGQRYRLDVRTTAADGSAAGQLLAVSDGVQRWQRSRGGLGDGEVQRVRLGAGTGEPRLLLSGPEPLLRSLDESLIWVHHERQGPGTLVTGAWRPDLREALEAGGEAWPAGLPRACRLTLTGRESWPGRLEWWGPAVAGGNDRLLIEIEFRDPRWGDPLPEAECRRLFAFDPAGAAVEDLTQTLP